MQVAAAGDGLAAPPQDRRLESGDGGPDGRRYHMYREVPARMIPRRSGRRKFSHTTQNRSGLRRMIFLQGSSQIDQYSETGGTTQLHATSRTFHARSHAEHTQVHAGSCTPRNSTQPHATSRISGIRSKIT